MGFFSKKESEEKAAVEVKMTMGEVYVNPGSKSQRRRNLARIERLKIALGPSSKNSGSLELQRELKQRELYEEAAKLGDEEK
jgi:hypothetical protein